MNENLEWKNDKKISLVFGTILFHLLREKIMGEVFIFGSYARLEPTIESDIDLLINVEYKEVKRISIIATKIEMDLEIPVHLTMIDDLDDFPKEAIMIYSIFPQSKNTPYFLISYRYLLNNRSKKTVFSRNLRKLLDKNNGKKLGNMNFIIPATFPIFSFIEEWDDLIEVQEKALVHVK